MTVVMMIGVGVYANSLVINEVAWAGTAASPTDEWIELFNATDQPVALAGWTLSFGDVVIDLGAGVETAVAPGEYFLLERTNDDTVSDVAADLIYTGSLSNDGAVLQLRDPSGKIADTANADHDGWIAGSSSTGPAAYATMERIDPIGPDEETNWKTNNGLNICGEDADGQALNGTPGQENSATIALETFPTVEITSPSPEINTVQGDVAIAWQADDPDGANGELLPIDIYLSCDSGQSFSPLVTNLVGDSYVWNTESVDDGDQYLLKVVAIDDDGNIGVAVTPIFSISNSG